MADANSPELPSPKQAVADAEQIIKDHKASKLPTPKQATARAERLMAAAKRTYGRELNAYRKKLIKEEFRVKKPTRESDAKKHIPTQEESEMMLRHLSAIWFDVEQKMKNDKTARVITSTKPFSPGSLQKVIEKRIQAENGEFLFQLDDGGDDDGRLQITHVASEYEETGANLENIIENVTINREGMKIFGIDPEGREENHMIFRRNTANNEINERTPAAVQTAEALMNIYLKS